MIFETYNSLMREMIIQLRTCTKIYISTYGFKMSQNWHITMPGQRVPPKSDMQIAFDMISKLPERSKLLCGLIPGFSHDFDDIKNMDIVHAPAVHLKMIVFFRGSRASVLVGGRNMTPSKSIDVMCYARKEDNKRLISLFEQTFKENKHHAVQSRTTA